MHGQQNIKIWAQMLFVKRLSHKFAPVFATATYREVEFWPHYFLSSTIDTVILSDLCFGRVTPVEDQATDPRNMSLCKPQSRTWRRFEFIRF